jgi:hypothetical protein
MRENIRSSGCYWIAAGSALGILILVSGLAFSRLRDPQDEATTPQTTFQVAGFSTPTAIQPTMPVPERSPGPSDVTVTPEATGLPFGLEDLVEVYGTGGDGLRLRSGPNLDASINAMGMENEVFEVRNGPSQADNYTWWYLVNPYDDTKRGWGVETYLRRLGSR